MTSSVFPALASHALPEVRQLAAGSRDGPATYRKILGFGCQFSPSDFDYQSRAPGLIQKERIQHGDQEKAGEGQESLGGEATDSKAGPLVAAGTEIRKAEVHMATKKKLAKGKKASQVKSLLRVAGR